MGTMRTIEDNKLIAEFMGYTAKDKDSVEATLIGSKYYWHIGNKMFYYIQGDWHVEDYLLFHIDWNWLMKVVDKIEDITNNDETYRYIIEILGTTVNVIETDRIIPIAETFERTKIEATYKAVIEFINFYNRQQNEN